MLRSQTYRIPTHHRRKKVRAQLIAAREFQYKYALFLASFGAVLSAIVGGATLYLLNHNYHLIVKAALLTSPHLVDNLFRELKITDEIVVICFLSFTVFLAILGIKLSQRIVVPIMLIQEKMKEICKGNLVDAKVHFRKTDEFQEFGETYNYLVDTLRMQLKTDIDKLMKLKPHERDRDAVYTWNLLVSEKQAQLTAPASSSPGPDPSVPHAS